MRIGKIKPNQASGIIALTIAIIVFAVYLSMLPQVYSDANFGMDAGDLLGAVLTDGVPHPTGYPTYLLLGKIIQFLPWGSPFFKGALLSAVFASSTAGLSALLSARLISERTPTEVRAVITAAVGMLAGFSPLLWSQAVIVEVYALAVFFIVCGLWWIHLVLEGGRDRQQWTYIFCLSVLIGLGFGNHLMLGLLAPGFLLAFMTAFKKKENRRNLIICVILVLTSAALIYAVLPLRAIGDPPINWGNPQTWEGFIWLISGQLYQGLSFRIPLEELFSRIFYFFTLLREQFGIAGLLLGVFGAVQFMNSEKKIRWVLLSTFLIYPLFSIGYTTNDSVVYTIPAFIVFTVWIGLGLSEAWALLETQPKWQTAMLGGVLSMLFLIRLPGVFTEVDPREVSGANAFAEACLEALPEDAILITQEDADTFPIWYHHFGLGERTDVMVITAKLLQFDWYGKRPGNYLPALVGIPL